VAKLTKEKNHDGQEPVCFGANAGLTQAGKLADFVR